MWINEDNLIILNQYDRACMHLVCRVMPSGKIIYGNKILRKRYPVLKAGAGKATLKEFGFIYDVFKKKYRQVHESKAKYANGKPRRWQGKTEFTYEEIVNSSIYGE